MELPQMDHDSIGGNVPRRGNVFTRWLGHLILRLGGWRIVGAIPDCAKMVVIGAPHTSNKDALIALGVGLSLQVRFKVMVKASAFRGPFDRFFRWLGGLPIERSVAGGMVEQCIQAFGRHDGLLLAVAPEGTRRAPAEWKRGYYHVAVGAGVPILPAVIDYDRKRVCFMPIIEPSGDYEQDWPQIVNAFRLGYPRHPERLSQPLCTVLGWPYQGAGAPTSAPTKKPDSP